MTTSPAIPSSAPLSDADLADLAVQALDAVLSSASVDVIGVSHWWDRATAALTTAAAAGVSWPRVCSTMARKLQIDAYAERDARTLTGIGAQLADPGVLARWCYLAERDTPYIVAMARIRRADRTAARKPVKSSPVSSPTVDLFAQETS